MRAVRALNVDGVEYVAMHWKVHLCSFLPLDGGLSIKQQA